MSDATRWRHVEALLDEASRLDPAGRPAFLEQACRKPDGATDAALREEVETLLALDPDAALFFDAAHDRLASVAGHLADDQDEATHAVPERVGAWRLVREVGRGGMGTVFLAERDDGRFEQTAAVKLVRPGLAPGLVDRFRAERQILARLDHPAIARLLDGGQADDGRPFLVMEYVDGEPVTDYCDRRRLGVNERLALFESVCEAVQFAHARLVVHRDLKPSNVMVAETEAGPRVKLLDFGIAKLLEEDGAAGLETAPDQRVMTPEYAAPEQIRGDAMTTATDVYALGVLLYELLTGRRPHAAAGGRHAVERAILETEPVRPSEAVTESAPTGGRVPADPAPPETTETGALRSTTADRLRRRLRGDLDRIVLRALAKEPERRYEGAGAFGADVRRHLAGLPVEARPDTVAYRVGKFVRRHRAGAAAALVGLLAVIGGAGVALWQATEARQAQARAETEAATAEEVAGFLEGLFTASDPAESQGDSVLVRDVLDAGVARLADLDGQPAVRARMQAVLGRVYKELGQLGRADTLLRAALNSGALADPDVAVDTRLVLASVLVDQGEYDASIAESRRALADARRRHSDAHASVASALTQVGFGYVSKGAFTDAEPFLEEAVAMQRRLHPEPHLDLAEALDNLGVLAYQERDYARAAGLMRQGLAIQRVLHRGQPHPDLAVSLDNVAVMLNAQDSTDEALSYLEESVAMQARLHPEPHPDRAITLNNYGVMLLDTGQLDAAERAFGESLAMKAVLYGPDNPSVGITIGWMGRVARERGQPALAETRLRRALAIADASYDPGHSTITGAAQTLAGFLGKSGRWVEAEQLYLRVYRQALAAHGPTHALTLQTLQPFPGFYRAWGRPTEVERWQPLLDAAEAANS